GRRQDLVPLRLGGRLVHEADLLRGGDGRQGEEGRNEHDRTHGGTSFRTSAAVARGQRDGSQRAGSSYPRPERRQRAASARRGTRTIRSDCICHARFRPLPCPAARKRSSATIGEKIAASATTVNRRPWSP